MSKLLRLILPMLLTSTLGGCGAVSYVLANLAPELPGPKIPAEYEGLTGHTVAVMIYADMNIRFDYPLVREELGRQINQELSTHLKKTKTIDEQQVVRYMDGHPSWRADNISDAGRSLGADSVLYVCLTEYTTQERGSLSLSKGRISGEAGVYDALPGKTGEDGCRWHRDSVSVTLNPEPGMFLNRDQLRQATQALFARQVGRYFYTYREENKSDDKLIGQHN